MSHDRARRRASRITRPAAALGVLSLSALGLTAVPAAAEIADPVGSGTVAAEAGSEVAAPGSETSAVEAPAAEVDAAAEEAPAEGTVPETPAADEGAAAEETGATAEEPVAETPATGESTTAEANAEAEATVGAQAVDPETGDVTIDLLGITDFHGALEQAPLLAGMINAIRAENPDTVFVSAGDNIGGSTYESAIQNDKPTIDVLNAMGLEASAVGNHEYDQGYADLAGRVADLADWDYLDANVEGAPELAPYEIVTLNGVDVAFIGSVTEETPRIVAADGIAGLTFTDPVAATNAIAAQLSDGNADNGEADVIVALSHEGTNVVAGALSADVDAAFTGHTHATTTAQTPSGAPVVQAGASGSHLGRITLTVSADGEVTAAGENIEVTGEGVTPDAAVEAIVDDAFDRAAVLGQAPVGSVTAPFNRGTDTGTSDGSNRGVESPLGNLLGEVAKWTAESIGLTPDLGIINPGGIRADLDPNADGVVTYAEAFGVQPFGNTIGTVDLTGEQVVTMLEQQFQPTESRPVLRLGLSADVDYTYDPTAPQGEHITDVLIGGEPIDLEAVYTVASNTFLLGGQDGFTVFNEGTNFTETGIVDLQGLVDFLEANPDLAPDYTQRSVGLTFVTDSTIEFTGGEEVIIDLASLSFTTNEPKPEFVTLLIDGEEAGQFEVDNTITPGTDETGRATVTFTVPDLTAYAEGDIIPFELVFGATPDSMQSIVLELEVTGAGVVVPPTDGGETPRPSPAPGKAPVVTPVAAPTGALPSTGADMDAAIIGAASLLLLGGLTIVAARQRRMQLG